MRRPILVRTAVSAAAAVLLVAGCGGGASSTSSKDPKAAFSAGLTGLTDTDVLTVTLKFDTTADNLVKLSKEGADGQPLTPAQAAKIAAASIRLETKTTNGKKLNQLKPGTNNATAFRFAFDDAGKTYAELRGVSDALFVKADVKSLLDLFEQSKAYDEVQARAGSLPSFVKDFVAGKWVSLDLNTLKALTTQMGVNTSPNQQQSEKLLNDLRGVLTTDVTVARVGTDDQGDHLRLTTQSRRLVGDLVKAVQSDVPGASLGLSKFDSSKVTDTPVTFDAWVSDGAVSKLQLDVGQFVAAKDKKPGDKLLVDLTFDRSGDSIDKPSGATPVDLTQLGSLLGGLGA